MFNLLIFITDGAAPGLRQANTCTLRRDGDANLLANSLQLVQMARSNVPWHHQEDNFAEIASWSIYSDASAAGDFFHRNVADGDAKTTVRRVPEQIPADVPAVVRFLASGSNDKLPSDSAAIPDSVHSLRFVLLDQHPLFHEETKVNSTQKQLNLS